MYQPLQIKGIAMLALLLFSFSLTGQDAKPKAPQFGKGISYMAKDSSFNTTFHLRMQTLYTANYDEASEETSSSFQIRRFRLKWDGYAFSPKLKYKVELGMSSRDISTSSEDGNTGGASRVILDAVLRWSFAKNWELWVGQTKLPGNRERVISSANLQFVDRSLVNSRFNIDRDAGIQLRGKVMLGRKAYLSPTLAISMGEGRNISSSNIGGYDYTARVEVLPMGKFANKGDYFGSDLAREEKPKISFGVTFDYNDGASRQGGQLGSFVQDSTGTAYAETDLTSFIADMMFKYKGWSVESEFATRAAEDNIADRMLSRGYRTGSGFTIATGYLFKNNVELALRYTTIDADDNNSGIRDEDQITLGLSKYIVGHSLKIQTDISRTVREGADDGVLMYRAQVEMQF